MKFLIFNTSVIAALVYLIVGQDQIQNFTKRIQKEGKETLKTATTFVKTDILSTNETPRIKKNINQSINVKNKQLEKSKIAAEQPPKMPLNVNIAPNNIQKTVTKKAPSLPLPEVVSSRPNTVAPKPVAVDDRFATEQTKVERPKLAKKDGSAFGSRQDLRKALVELARSAEDLFIDRLAR
ncbi:MAG: hypothetical protein CMM58_02145 [Rhodospirillaceae bacterium]|mgnify:CR=1 FL=1|nr:hypothetical protein [Rhodospirillaceae bacterium]|tara:strand:- start:13 stop:555 length:543 start_codon:yes stop_codon:yes gene_type:complete